jgi:HlyD family secretion protein
MEGMMKPKIKNLVLVIAALIAGLGLFSLQKARTKTGVSLIKVSGNIEATQVRLSFRIPGKIKELLVDEGSIVKTARSVARLDTDELVKVKAQAQAALTACQIAFAQAGDDYKRADSLFGAGAISAQKRDTAKTVFDSAKAGFDQAQAGFELADTRLGFADLASSIDGFVTTKSAESGEVVQAGAPVFTVADLHDVWLTAYVNETDLAKVKLGQAVRVKTDTFPDKAYDGRLSFIAQEAEFTPKQIQTNEERVKLVYRVKIKIDNPALELKPGMPADGYIVE